MTAAVDVDAGLVRSAATATGTLVTDETTLHPTDTPVNNYRALLRRHRLSLGLLAVTSGIAGLIEALILILITRSAFAVSDGEDTIGLIGTWNVARSTVLVIAVGLVLVTVIFQIASTWQSARLGALVVARIRHDLTQAFLRATWASQHGERMGKLQELLTTFIRGGAQLITATTLATIAVCNLVALVVTALFIDALAALALLVIMVFLGLLVRPIRGLVRKEARITADAGMEFATKLGETSQLGMEMHVFNVQNPAIDRLAELIEANRQTNRRLAFLQQSVPTTYGSMSYLALIGGLVVIAAIGSTDLTSVGAVTLIMFRAVRYGQMLQINTTTINANIPFLDALGDELERYRGARVVDHGEPIGEIGEMRLANVSFEYDAGTPVLRGIEATIGTNEIIGVIGPSGSGKSTLVQLLLGLRDPSEGSVLSGERDIRRLSRVEWARRVTFVPQQAHLIAGTVADNIRFLRDGVADDEIERAARLANLHDDVMAWPERYERQVGESGSHLSGGQQQRLIIARALVEQPDLLIMDEPTSALDARSEHLVRGSIRELRREMSIVVIAHRLSTLEDCDRIMVILDGELRGFDTPQRLREHNAFYQEALIMSEVR